MFSACSSSIYTYLSTAWSQLEQEGTIVIEIYLGELDVFMVGRNQELNKRSDCQAHGRSGHPTLRVTHHGIVRPRGHVAESVTHLQQNIFFTLQLA